MENKVETKSETKPETKTKPLPKYTCLLFPSGVTAFCKYENQLPHMQTSWFELVLNDLSSKGMSDEDIMKTAFHLPNNAIAKPFRTSEGKWNWEIVYSIAHTL